jgi:hypothetical protein
MPNQLFNPKVKESVDVTSLFVSDGPTLIKKKIKFFLINKEIHKRLGAKSFMTNGFLLYD